MNIFSVIKHLFAFHVVTVIGIIVGAILFNIHSEANPLSSFLLSSSLYFIGLLIVFSLHFIYWIFVDKGTFYNIKSRLLDMITDYIYLIIATMATVGTLFMIDTFL